MNRPDPIDILVRNQAEALMAHGVSQARAFEEAEVRVAKVLDELNQIGLADTYLRVAIRRARVYRLRCQGESIDSVCETLNIRHTTEWLDYRAELTRRRLCADLQT